ncbi:MAG TPA: DUF5709 domain-containing protein [Nonomuraea sp.]|uniref:DUF5709 domain-containing protein n=1 Tax=Nonomuraea sp. NPDC049649 TaxID=3155776 RepID=UPI002CED4589|nr:DUF5709 domain-containing protein [Nonomuraea sp.]
MTERDPRSRFEDEGIPDLQNGTPEQQWAEDPQEAPLPADYPVGVDEYGTTVDEQIQGESLEGRLEREVPEEEAAFGADIPVTVQRAPEPDPDERPLTEDGGLGVGSDLDTSFQPDSGVDERVDPSRAGRLVAEDEGAHSDTEPDEVARDVGADGGGYSAEEAAMRIEPE